MSLIFYNAGRRNDKIPADRHGRKYMCIFIIIKKAGKKVIEKF